MGERPNLEEALKKVGSRYELVSACAKRALQLMKDNDDIFIRDKASGHLIKKTFQAIQDIAEGKADILRRGKAHD